MPQILKNKTAFSLIELSVVILIIGVIVAGVTQSSRLISSFKLNSARSLTQSSPVASIKNIVLWWETTSTASFTESQADNNQPVDTWKDINPQSSTKYNAIQNTDDNKPTYIANCANSLPCLRFTNVSNSPTYSDFMTYDASGIVNTEFTIFLVEQRRTPTDGNFPMAGNTGTTNGNLHLGYRNSTTFTFASWANDTDITVTAYSNPMPQIYTATLSSTNGKRFYVNGVSKISSSSQTALLVSYLGSSIGRTNISNFYYTGDMLEVIMFSRVLTTEERRVIEAYLGKKWNVVVS